MNSTSWRIRFGRRAATTTLMIVWPWLFGASGRAAPNIGYAYPAGGQRGTTLVVSVGGQSLAGANAAYFSLPGVKTKVVSYDRPLTQKEVNDAREKQTELQEKRTASKATATDTKPGATRPEWTADDEAKLEELRMLLAKRPTRLATPAIAETVLLLVTLPAEAAPGDYEFRVRSTTGLSNPLVFQVSDLPETTELVVTGSTTPPPSPAAREAALRSPAKKSARTVTLPTVVNGQIMPGEVDRIRFVARKGQKLTLATSARTLIPYLADAVPGWFQATLALYDPQGREVAYDDDYRFNPDPVIACTIPVDGEYTVEIKDSIFRGREDFVYRIVMGELPFLTGIFPLGSAPQATTTFDLDGWNLPSDHMTIPAENRPAGTFLLAVRNGGRLSNPVRFAIDHQAETLETAKANNCREEAQALALPAIVNGRIETPDDIDTFVFDGRAGQEIVAEVFARRLQSPLDSVIELTDATGRSLALNDDADDKGAGLITHHADSRIAFTLPADGKYFLRLTDAQHRGSRDFAYRLKVGAPQPDFELRVVPSTLNVRAGASVPVTVFALRRDGFKGEIVLGLKDAPRGFSLSGARIPPGVDQVRMTLTAPATPLEEPCGLRLIGRGGPAEQPVFHSATPADDMMQAFLYRHLVTARELKINVSGRGSTLRPANSTPLRLTAGGEARLQFSYPGARGLNKVHVELSEPPAGVSIKRTNLTRDGFEVVIACDAASAKTGIEGNLILNAFGERGAPKAGKQPQRAPLATAPAIPFEIVAPPPRST
ncbi:PPC domain-containing protein [Horticoccus sp. 23ND18S-11]|uniref:PPC domain-containing protein n=1 Tax=Horticoccus sp. 23ND18S-11 TaxID=3391832 RepID=UPI0039C93457